MDRGGSAAEGGDSGVNACRLCGLVLVGALAADKAESPVEREGTRAMIRDLEIRADIDTLRVSFRVDGAFGLEVRERMGSGLPVTFSHRVELLVRRAVPVIPSRVLARAIVDSTARYDSLTRQYYLSRRFSRELSGEVDSVVDETKTTTTLASEAEAWLAGVHDVALPAPPSSAKERKVRVRVRTVLGRRYHLLIFPANDSADAEQVLLP